MRRTEQSITINGRSYRSVDEMPDEDRRLYEQAMASMAHFHQEGVSTIEFSEQSVVVTDGSIDQRLVPTESDYKPSTATKHIVIPWWAVMISAAVALGLLLGVWEAGSDIWGAFLLSNEQSLSWTDRVIRFCLGFAIGFGGTIVLGGMIALNKSGAWMKYTRHRRT